MDWTNKNVAPSKVVQLGDEVEVMVLEIDEDRRRISLGMKQCKANPWDDFAISHKKGDKVRGAIKSITDFGVFIGLAGNIDGLVHSVGSCRGAKPVKRQCAASKRAMSSRPWCWRLMSSASVFRLGVKQLEGDPFNNYCAMNDKGALVHGVVKSVEPKGAAIDHFVRRG
jgi:small subunit ribosomal protein S1